MDNRGKFGIFKVAYGDMMSKIEISRRTREKGCCYGASLTIYLYEDLDYLV
jgi:hypothetical protein